MKSELRLFGTPTRSRTLLAVALLGETYPRELARVASVPLVSVQRIINDLDRQNVVATRLRGTQREVRLNPSYFAYVQLRELLLRLAPAAPDIVVNVESLRRRPRRFAKEL